MEEQEVAEETELTQHRISYKDYLYLWTGMLESAKVKVSILKKYKLMTNTKLFFLPCFMGKRYHEAIYDSCISG
jgi:hypothetical protein